jgi:hypothetical protein
MHQAMPHSIDCRLGARFNPYLTVDIAKVDLDGVDTNMQLLGYLLIGSTTGNNL